MSDIKKEKSPYKDYSIEEIMATETGSYYIQIGDNMFESDSGKLAFNKERADHFFFAVWEGLNDLIKHGNSKEKEEALQCLLNFRIVPLRLH